MRANETPNRRWPSPSSALISLFFTASLQGAEPPAADKGQYHLFNPTPRQWMREMSTDRPDATESPYTVDAGHFQLEADLLNFAYDRYNPEKDGTRVHAYSFAAVNLKAGLLNNLDLQLIVPTYNYVRIRDGTTGDTMHLNGFGDIVARAKYNVWGNDGGTTAFGIMPFIKLPTAQDDLGNGSVEGGLILPLAVQCPKGWALGLMTEVDAIRDDTGDGHHAEFINTITVGRGLVGNLGMFIEFFSLVSAESDSDWVGTFNTGFTYGLTRDLQLDAGINIGLTRSAEDWNPFVGVSWRF